jgi:uncharacterized membrane protein SirB2
VTLKVLFYLQYAHRSSQQQRNAMEKMLPVLLMDLRLMEQIVMMAVIALKKAHVKKEYVKEKMLNVLEFVVMVSKLK